MEFAIGVLMGTAFGFMYFYNKYKHEKWMKNHWEDMYNSERNDAKFYRMHSRELREIIVKNIRF